MNWYRVTLLGRNFLLSIDGKTGPHGFHATRRVEAADAASAERQAVELVKQDGALKGAVLNDTDDPPLIFLEEISTDDRGVDDPGAGYAFFPEVDGAGEASLDLEDPR